MKKRRLQMFLSIALTFMLLLAVGCGSTPSPSDSGSAPSSSPENGSAENNEAPEKEKIVIGVPVVALSYAPLFVADGANLLSKHGLQVEIKTITGGLASDAALIGGDVDVLVNATPEFLKLVQKGEPVVAVQGLTHLVTQDLIVSNQFIQQNGIDPEASIKERIGKMKSAKFGTVSLGGTSDLYARWLLDYAGLDGRSDLEMIRVGGTPALIAAVQSNQIDAFLLSPPAGLLVEELGVGTILVESSEVPEFTDNIFTLLYTTDSFAEKNPNTMRSLVAAIGEAQDLLANDPERSAEALGPFFESTSPEILQKSLESIQTAFGRNGIMSTQHWEKALTLSRESGLIEGEVSVAEGQQWTNEFNDN